MGEGDDGEGDGDKGGIVGDSDGVGRSGGEGIGEAGEVGVGEGGEEVDEGVDAVTMSVTVFDCLVEAAESVTLQ